MKKMHKILALVLVVGMMVAVLVGCGGDPDDRGAIIYMYLGADPSNVNLDPALMLFSREAVKFIGLLFEGMTVMDDRGRLENGMAQNIRIIEDEDRGIFRLQFELHETRWSDGTQVTAQDFAFAWKRILQPDFSSPAAALLFDIRNAREVKRGEMTVDDLGVAALSPYLLEVSFDSRMDYNRFLENLASLALVPLRDSTVDFEPDNWAMSSGTPIGLSLLSNGPFAIRSLEFNRGALFERSIYYRLDGRRNENIFRYVRPFRLSLDFSRSLDAQATAFAANDIEDQMFFLGNVPRDRFDESSNRAEIRPMLSAYSLHFNAEHPILGRAEVRQALSIALNRNEIANMVGLGVVPATGIVPHGIVGEVATGADFRTEAEDVINPAGDMAGARSLLQAAGVSSGSFELKVRNEPGEVAVAEYIAGVWRELGFNVSVTTVQGIAYANNIFDRDYDVMLYDFQASGVNPWSVLAPFAMPFSGMAQEFDPVLADYIPEPHITGFQNDAYDALIEEIFMIDDRSVRHARYREAERMLVELSPIAPLYFNTSINITEQITGITFSRFGFPIFSRATLRNHQTYTTTEEPRELVQ